MATGAFDSKGSLFQRGDGAVSETFYTVGEVKGVDLSPKSDTYDASSLASTGGYREWIPGFKDSGEMKVDAFFDPTNTQQVAMRDAFEAQSLNNYRIVFSDLSTTTATFAAYVVGYMTGAKVGALAEMSLSLKISGPVTWS